MVDKKEVAKSKVYLFPSQAEEEGADVDLCLWTKLDFKFDENVKYCPNQNESPKYLMEFQPNLSQNDEIGFQI